MSRQTYFDDLAETWDEISKHDESKIRFLISKLELSKESRILDVGSGTGVLIPFLREYSEAEIVEVDLSAKMLEQAEKKYPLKNIRFVCGDASDLSLDLGEFDTVICYSMFPHFENHAEAIKALAKRVKNTGSFAVLHSMSRAALNQLHENAGEHVSKDLLPDIDVMKGYMKEAGLSLKLSCDDESYYYAIARR